MCGSPVEPTETRRPSVKARACSWQVPQDWVPFPESRVS
jgi:hypothetical protein